MEKQTNEKTQKGFFSKISKRLTSLTMQKVTVAAAIIFVLAFIVTAGNVIVKNGQIISADNMSVDTGTFVVDATNNRVGVGTSAPTRKLSINDAPHAYLSFNNGTERWAIGSEGAGYDRLIFHDSTPGAGYRMIIDKNGNVGVGTTTPSVKLELSNNTALKVGAAYLSSGNVNYAHFANNEWFNGSAWMTTGTAGALIQLSGQTIYFFKHDGAGSHTTLVTMEDTGNVGISDTTPDGDIDIGSSYANSGDAHWTVESSSEFKDNIQKVESDPSILDKWMDVSVYDWNYKESHLIEQLGYNKSTEETKALADVRHRGMMADEFNPLFMNNNKKTLSGDDVQNAMIQTMQELIKENKELKVRVAALEAR